MSEPVEPRDAAPAPPAPGAPDAEAAPPSGAAAEATGETSPGLAVEAEAPPDPEPAPTPEELAEAARQAAEAARFARQRALPGLGEAAVERLRAATVHVVGAGAAAGPAILALAQAGVGALLLDEPDDVLPGDEAAWLYRPGQQGAPRLVGALAAAQAASAFSRVRPHATGSVATATLVCTPDLHTASLACERARLAGIPHVAAVAEGDGGFVIAVPLGAPCFACASRRRTGLYPEPGAHAPLGLLAALELLLLLARVPGGEAGRRLDLAAGAPTARPTERRTGCGCTVIY